MDLYNHFFPLIWGVLTCYFNKFSAPFSLPSPSEIPIIFMLPFLMEFNTCHRIFLYFSLYPSFLSSFTCLISVFLSLSSLILSSKWSALFPMLSNSFFIFIYSLTLLIEFLSSRISLCFLFIVSVSLAKYFFCSLVLFLTSLNVNCLSEFSCGSLSFFMTAVLNSLYSIEFSE